ncbi:MAG: alpha-L-fucosidase [Bacteroidota bacterium]
MKKSVLLLMSILLSCTSPEAGVNTPADAAKMQWFRDAKLGIFIHYGIYAVNGTVESWPIHNNQIPYEEYMAQAKGFTASKFDADAWADLFAEAGAKYVVLTSKHHDGFALWDTRFNELSSVKGAPAKRDIITPYAEALRKKGLKVGVYFSHLDWSNPDYATVFSAGDPEHKDTNKWDFPESGREDPERWEEFIRFRNGQIMEVQELVHPDLWWFDGDWTRTAEQWKMKELREMLLAANPEAILNARMQGYGDYLTPEQGVPISGPDGNWELCMTINDSWGYRQSDTNQKTVDYIIHVFAECIGQGGNLLLDAGPMEDGTFTPEQVGILRELGRWTKKHAEAIYGTVRGIPYGHFYGPTTLSKDRKTLYCYQFDDPKTAVAIKGIKNKINRIRVVGSEQELKYTLNGGAAWMGIPPVVLVDLPAELCDEKTTVIAVDLDSPLNLYEGQGGADE